MSITKGLGGATQIPNPAFFVMLRWLSRREGARPCVPCPSPLLGRSWKAPAPSRGAAGTGGGLRYCGQEQEGLGQRADPRGQERRRIRRAHQPPEGGMD